METFLNEVVVMEDDKKVRATISSVLKGLGFQVKYLNDADAIIQNAHRRSYHWYILDINMGRGREQEGLDALEQIKNFNQNTFVGVLSGYPDIYKRMAKNLKADWFQEKTTNTKRDVYHIIDKMLTRKEAQFRHRISSVRQSIRNVIISDDNVIEYKILRSDKKWLVAHEGYYVAFVDGVEKGKCIDRNKLLKEARTRYPSKRIFITKVDKIIEFIDLPSPLEILEK